MENKSEVIDQECSEEDKELQKLLITKTELEERLSQKAKLRYINLNAEKNRPELNKLKLDSSLKKNTAFIKKMKNLTESQQESLEKELYSLNLSKYISEISQAIVEAKLKMSDVNAVVQISSHVHQRYSDFSSHLLENWQKILSWKRDEKITNLSKLRVDLRLFGELISAGIFTQKEGLFLLGSCLISLVNSDKSCHQNISVLLSFCKYCGEDYLGIVPRKLKLWCKKFNIELPSSDFLPREKQKNVCNLLKDYYSSLIKHLIKDHNELNKIEQQNAKLLQTKGELSDERKSIAESMSTALIKLLNNAAQLADLLDEDFPEMPTITTSEQEEILNESSLTDGEKQDLMQNIWDDEDEKAFYTFLPQLKVLLPSILYAESEKAEKPVPIEVEVSCESANGDREEEEEEDNLENPEIKALEEEVEELYCSNRDLYDAFINSLSNCINRELIDAAALEFCLKLNTKAFRRKLAKTIFLVPRTRLDLLPFYARFVAALRPVMPDFATDIFTMMKQDFKYQVRKKDQINIETKIKVVRFIGEMTKFEIYPRSETLICLRLLLNNFKHHHIEMTCNLLETCGRYLYRNPDSHHRTKVFLDQMMRKKTVKALDPRYETMIENAYYHVNPPETVVDSSREEIPTMHKYISVLLYSILTKLNTERILRQVRKLHWEDKDIADCTVSCLSSPWKAKFYNIKCIANLVAGLLQYYDWVGPVVVDNVLEDIRFGLEASDTKYNQRRIAAVKYLGELYNYRVIESMVIFKTLYSLITFGVSWDPSKPTKYDPPTHLIRLRLVSTLLDTCGLFFSSGASKKRLDCFLPYFQLYYWFKKSVYVSDPFPWQIEHMVKDTITTLRSKTKLFESFEECQEGVDKLNKQIFDKAVQVLPTLKDYVNDNEGDLQTIREEESENENSFVELEEEEDDNQDLEIKREDLEEGRQSLTPQHSTSQQNSQALNSQDISSDEQSANNDLCGEVNVKIKTLQSVEDEDFMSEFDRMMSDNFLERTREHTPRNTCTNISVPMHVKSVAKKNYEQLISEGVSDDKPMVNFVLLTKSGNKAQCTNVEMPIDSALVHKLRTREEAERLEKDRVKQLTLEINERREEEEAQDILQQPQKHSSSLLNINWEKKPKYQHPKGAPDADLIFGSKKPK